MEGIIAAVPTPVDEQGAPVHGLFIEHCQWALANGCDGLNVLGSTGEANSHGADARAQVMGWAADALDVTRLMVGTGTPSLADTVELTQAADDLGYGVALVLPPFYYKPLSDDGLFAYYKALHQQLGTRRIALYFYNYPQMTGLVIPVGVISRLAQAYPDRFKGIKDSSGDLNYARDIVAAVPGFRVFPSSETALGDAVSSGFAGCISATVNVSAQLCGKIWDSRETIPGDLLTQAGEIRAAIASCPLVPAVKYMVARRTGHREWERVVPPFLPVDDVARAKLDAISL